MTKIQKIWMWIFIAMFAVPEILFLSIPLSLANILGYNFSAPVAIIFGDQFLSNNAIFFIFALAELVGAGGLLILFVRTKKIAVSIFLAIILIWLLFIFYIAGVYSTMSPVI